MPARHVDRGGRPLAMANSFIGRRVARALSEQALHVITTVEDTSAGFDISRAIALHAPPLKGSDRDVEEPRELRRSNEGGQGHRCELAFQIDVASKPEGGCACRPE